MKALTFTGMWGGGGGAAGGGASRKIEWYEQRYGGKIVYWIFRAKRTAQLSWSRR